MRLRAVELRAADVSQSADFLERVWGLRGVPGGGRTRYFRGTGDHPYLVSLTAAPVAGIEAITFSGSPDELQSLRERNQTARHFESAYGAGIEVEGPDGQRYRFVTDSSAGQEPAEADRPIQLSHVVLNTRDWEACERFAVEKLGMRVSDRTRIMRFLRCNRKHHSLAYVDAKVSSLNHIAFEMRDLDAVMNGIGRLREAGVPCVWGPGRHGPGNNVFGYFIAPFGGIVEYTAEVEEIGDDYPIGGPADWQWPPGRTDHWGIAARDTDRMQAAERAVPWT